MNQIIECVITALPDCVITLGQTLLLCPLIRQSRSHRWLRSRCFKFIADNISGTPTQSPAPKPGFLRVAIFKLYF